MLNPEVSEYVFVKNYGAGLFGVFARQDIPDKTIIEICPVIILTKKDAIVLGKTVSAIQSAIFVDELVLGREAEILSHLREFQLEERLDSGEITAAEYTKLLLGKMDTSALLESKSHVLILGNGALYKISDKPNLVFEYHPGDMVGIFKSATFISKGTQLTYFKQ